MRSLNATQETFSHTSGKSINEIAKDLGIGCSMLARWKIKQEEYKDNAFPGLGKVRRGTDLKEENRRLKKELALVQEERDILKKLCSSFPKSRNEILILLDNSKVFHVKTMCRVLKSNS